MSDLIQRIASLSPEQRALFERRLQQQGLTIPVSHTIAKRQQDNGLPLSFAQQRLWLVDQLEPGNPVYNLAAIVRLNGRLEVSLLERTLSEIQQRHEILRTTFPSVDGHPVQWIQSAQPLTLPITNLEGVPETAWETTVQQAAMAEARQPFCLAEGPLLRVRLLKLSDRQHVLIVAMPHIITDAWSTGVFVREVAALYDAFAKGQPSPLPTLPIQYGDFAIWQRQWLQGDRVESHLAYWRQQLDNCSMLDLPTDRLRPAIQSHRGDRADFKLSPSLTQALTALSQQEGVTLFMTLLAAFKTLLHRYTRQGDIVVGSPIASRNRAEIEGLIGFFVNMLVLRTDLSGQLSFRNLLRRVQDVTLAAYAHQDLSFEQIVDALQPDRDLSHTPLFQVTFALNAPMPSFYLPDLTLTLEEVNNQTTKFDLMVSLFESTDGLSGRIEYSTDLFDAATIARLTYHFQTLLEGIVTNPDQPLSTLPILPPSERHQLLVEWNPLDSKLQPPRCIHHRFEAQVDRTPDAIAVTFGEQRFSYRDLNQRANQLAHYLQAHGVAAGTLVGLCVDRSIDLVIGILGILKAGGAYVPLDPAYPQAHLSFLLVDAQIAILVTQSSVSSRFTDAPLQVIALDTDGQTIAQQPCTNPHSLVNPGDSAYVIYTSGSTGKPKGALVTHANVTRLLTATEPWFHFNEQDVWTLFHSYAFDFSVWELWGALLYGGRLVVVPYWVSRSPADFYDLLHREHVTVLNQTPSAFRQLMQVDEQANGMLPLALRFVIFGGEALEPTSLKPWCDRHGDQQPQLINMYGITETTVHVTYRRITIADIEGGSGSVIGRPIPDLQVYILDEHQQPVPIGIPGELYVGGAGVSKGYLNRPELTTERFIPNPFEPTSPLLYKSGDLARYRPNGEIEYLGRIDYQVKIRGFRIELGEIEAAIAAHPMVRETVVLVWDDPPGTQRLVAYVVARPESSLSAHDLRAFLQSRLPDYLVPVRFVMLEALPLTPNGKLDRRALPAPDATRPDLESHFTPPRTPTETLLVQIWSQVLGMEQVGIHDNFFELGGDSILSMQIVARATQQGLTVASPKQVFQHQTIAQLAAAIDATKGETKGNKPIPTTEQGLVTGAVPLTPIQHWFFAQICSHPLSNPHHWNQSVWLELPATDEPALLEQALQSLLAHHDALRLRFTPHSSGWHQTHAEPDDRPIVTTFDLSGLPVANQTTALQTAALDLQASLHLTNGPLIRVARFYLGTPQPDRLLLIVHHLAIDGVSWRILLDDLQHLYLSPSLSPHLPPKTTSFKHWSDHLQTYARSTALLSELEYWLKQSRQPVTPLPVDQPGGTNRAMDVRCLSRTLSVEETQALLQAVPAAYRTQINEILLTALVQTLTQWTGSRSLRVDLEGHGREELVDAGINRIDLFRTIGWFTTIFPVFFNVESADSSIAILKAVKHQLREIPNHGIGYGILRYLSQHLEAQPLKDVPPAEISFNYLGQLEPTLRESSRFRLMQVSGEGERDPQSVRPHLLEVNGFVLGKQLHIEWHYSEQLHHRATITPLADAFMQVLRSLIEQRATWAASTLLPSDFPRIDLTSNQLDRLLADRPPVETIAPLSPMQQGLLFHTLYEPESTVYFVQLSCTLRGHLNVAAFQHAWQQVIQRHSVLRTGFEWEWLDQPLQMVYQQVDLPWEEYDWRDRSPNEHPQHLQAFRHADRQRGFALSNAPLMRLILIQLDNDSYHFIWSHHHLLMDGWSVPIVLQDVFAIYQAQGQSIHLEPSRPYSDYLTWLQQQDLSQAEPFWRSQLSGFTSPVPLQNTTRNQLCSSDQTDDYHTLKIYLATDRTTALNTFTRSHQLTLNTLIQGTWALLLSWCSGRSDVLFGVTVSGRPPSLVGVDSMVGLFINTLPMRVQISPQMLLPDWLQQLQSQQVQSSLYDYTPLPQIHRWSEIPAHLSLFESTVVFQNYPVDPALRQGSGDLEIEPVEFASRNNYPLTVRATPGTKLMLEMIYNRSRFDTPAIKQRLHQMEQLLNAIALQPHVQLETLQALLETANQQQKIHQETAFRKGRQQKLGQMERRAIRPQTGS
jgi:amino acid adenylation domain-containing protein/non-ribosomal peptide synthase protein (TIGR01720 family)